MLVPVGTAMLFRAFPPIERAKASTVLIIPTVLAPALGPIIGGWLVTDVSWRWIFYVNLPVGIFGFIVGFLFLKEHREPTAGRFDVAGFVLSGTALALGALRALGGAREGLDVAGDPRHRPRRARPVRDPGLRRDAHPRTDARAAPLRGAHVPQRQPGARADLRKLRRHPLPPAALPAGAARALARCSRASPPSRRRSASWSRASSSAGSTTGSGRGA